MLQDLVAFLEENVDGRTLYTDELTYALEDGALEGVYSDQISFSNLKYSRYALELDMFIVSNEKIYRMEGMERCAVRKDFSAVSLFRFELAERQSIDDITGLFRYVSASGKNVPAQAIVSAIDGVHIKDDMLILHENQLLYRDQPIQNGYKPVSFESTQRFFLRDDKLHYEYDGMSFDYDPAAQTRHPSADTFPKFCSAER